MKVVLACLISYSLAISPVAAATSQAEQSRNRMESFLKEFSKSGGKALSPDAAIWKGFPADSKEDWVSFVSPFTKMPAFKFSVSRIYSSSGPALRVVFAENPTQNSSPQHQLTVAFRDDQPPVISFDGETLPADAFGPNPAKVFAKIFQMKSVRQGVSFTRMAAGRTILRPDEIALMRPTDRLEYLKNVRELMKVLHRMNPGRKTASSSRLPANEIASLLIGPSANASAPRTCVQDGWPGTVVDAGCKIAYGIPQTDGIQKTYTCTGNNATPCNPIIYGFASGGTLLCRTENEKLADKPDVCDTKSPLTTNEEADAIVATYFDLGLDSAAINSALNGYIDDSILACESTSPRILALAAGAADKATAKNCASLKDRSEKLKASLHRQDQQPRESDGSTDSWWTNTTESVSNAGNTAGSWFSSLPTWGQFGIFGAIIAGLIAGASWLFGSDPIGLFSSGNSKKKSKSKSPNPMGMAPPPGNAPLPDLPLPQPPPAPAAR